MITTTVAVGLAVAALAACVPPNQGAEVVKEDCTQSYNGWSGQGTAFVATPPWGYIYNCHATNFMCNPAGYGRRGSVTLINEPTPVPLRIKSGASVAAVNNWDEANGNAVASTVALIGSITYDSYTVVAAKSGYDWTTCGGVWWQTGTYQHLYRTPWNYVCKDYHVISIIAIPMIWNGGWYNCNG